LIPQEGIAALVGISRGTLQKYYLDDWLRGKAKASRRVAFRLEKLLEAGSEKAILHLAKVELGLTETRRHEHEVSGKDGDLLTIRDYSDGASGAASCARCTTRPRPANPRRPRRGGGFLRWCRQ
jgi:hypothetical protein